MSKWIHGFQPNKDGNYLIKTVTYHTTAPHIIIAINYARLEYKSDKDIWHNGDGFRVMAIMRGDNYERFWWDEYGITETKKKRKEN